MIAQLQNERGMGGQAPEKLEETAQKADTLRQELRVLEDRIAELEAADLISRVSALEKASSQAAALGPQADRKNRPELSNMTHEEVVKCLALFALFVPRGSNQNRHCHATLGKAMAINIVCWRMPSMLNCLLFQRTGSS